MPAIPYKGDTPDLGKNVFIAPNAWVTGKVTIEDNVSIFFGAALRGDIYRIRVGQNTNIQEQSILHTSSGMGECVVGKNVTIGHRAIIHGATVENNVLIGMGAIILDKALIGAESIIAAGTLVPLNIEIPPRSLVMGVPGKVIREITDEELEMQLVNMRHYVEVGREYEKFFSSRNS